MAHDANEAAQAATTSAMAEEYQMTAETARDQGDGSGHGRAAWESPILANKIHQSE